MKKGFLLLIAIAGLHTASQAQEVFPLSGARWTYEYSITAGPPFNSTTFFSYVLQGDTIIDDVQRAKAYFVPDISKNDSLLIGYFHVIDSVVYYRQDENDYPHDGHYGVCYDYYNQDYPLYDFSMQKDDIFPGCYGDCKVIDTDYIDMGGVERKRLIMSKFGDGNWIEGMGSTLGLFNHVEAIPIHADIYRGFICFSQNGNTLYLDPGYEKCPEPGDFSVTDAERYVLSVAPNPAEKIVTVSSPELLRKIALYDSKGALLFERAYEGEQQAVLSVVPYSAGTYCLVVTLQNGNTKAEKLIVK